MQLTNPDRTSLFRYLSQVLVLALGVSLLPFNSTSSTTFAAQAETVQQLTAKADEMVKKKRFDEAKKLLNKALKLDKDSIDANTLLAVVCREDNNRKEAIKYAYEAIRIDPQRADLHYFLAVLLYETTESGQAKIELDKAVNLGANFANVFALKGDLEVEDEDFRSALATYQKALQLIPESSGEQHRIEETVETLTNYLAFSDKKVARNPAITKPKMLTLPMPRYTADARTNKIQGTVRVRALVDETGSIKFIFFVSRLGYGLDEEARAAAMRTKFSPATVDHQPMPYWIILEVSFSLR